MKIYSNKVNLGQSLYEVLFAIAVAAIVVVGIATLSTTSVRNSIFSRDNALATKHAQAAIEWLRQEKDRGWTEFADHANPSSPTTYKLGGSGCCNWSNSTDVIAGTIFKRNLTMTYENTSPIVIQVDLVVSWDSSGVTRRVRTSTRFAPWRSI